MKQNNSLLYFIAFTISLLFIQACRDDDRDLLPPESNPQGQAIFTLNVPKKNGTETRAMDDEQEDAITHMTFLGFVTTNNTEQLDFSVEVGPSGITRNATDKKIHHHSHPQSRHLLLHRIARQLRRHTQ
ncbi:MAG: hypothetical protein LUG51_06860 [Tannerellaceae bacterium]|nr:hypothetical protein [Tannerellaceae bacterium]